MAREKHLTAVHIGNFKRFVDFKVENLGQFNLVVGDNNTGKTSFLEALVLDEEIPKDGNIRRLNALLEIRKSTVVQEQGLEEIVAICRNREEGDSILIIGFYYNVYNSLVAISDSDLGSLVRDTDLEKLHGKFIKSTSDKSSLILLVGENGRMNPSIYYSKKKGFSSFVEGIDINVQNDVSLNRGYPFINFMPFGAGYDNDLEQVYDEEVEQSRVRLREMILLLKLFIPNVVDLRLRKGEITVYESNQDLGMPLYTYGEGAVKFFRILCYMSIAKGKRLMIDEIDTGIHHSKFKDFWIKLMQAATAYDVQLFATTHNEECLEYFQAALEEETMQEQRDLARVILLRENKDKSVFAQVHNYQNMLEAEEAGYELRGRG